MGIDLLDISFRIEKAFGIRMPFGSGGKADRRSRCGMTSDDSDHGATAVCRSGITQMRVARAAASLGRETGSPDSGIAQNK